jgi:hypothetical protein
LEKNKENENVWYTVSGAIIFALTSLMISYEIVTGIYIAISILSLGLASIILLLMAKIVESEKNQQSDRKSEFIKLVVKLFPIVIIYQLYLLDYIFIAGLFSTFSVISISISLAKIMGTK